MKGRNESRTIELVFCEAFLCTKISVEKRADEGVDETEVKFSEMANDKTNLLIVQCVSGFIHSKRMVVGSIGIIIGEGTSNGLDSRTVTFDQLVATNPTFKIKMYHIFPSISQNN